MEGISEFFSPLVSSPASRMCLKISKRIEGKLEFIPSFSPCRHRCSSDYISLPKPTAAGGGTSSPVLHFCWALETASSHFLPTAPFGSWVLFPFCESLQPPRTIMSSPSITPFHTHSLSGMLGRDSEPPAYRPVPSHISPRQPQTLFNYLRVPLSSRTL